MDEVKAFMYWLKWQKDDPGFHPYLSQQTAKQSSRIGKTPTAREADTLGIGDPQPMKDRPWCAGFKLYHYLAGFGGGEEEEEEEQAKETWLCKWRK